MKKGLYLIIVLLLAISLVFVACKEVEEEKEYSIVAPDGATALALASFVSDGKLTEAKTIKANVVSASAIAAEAIKSDFAIVPVNLAAKMYNNGAKIKVISTITNGNLFLVSSVQKENFTMQDMKGKMLYTIGQGAVPSMILLRLLQLNEIEYEVSDTPIEGKVAIKYCQDGPTLLPYIIEAKINGSEVYGMLAEPAVTKATEANKAHEVLDIQKEFKQKTNSTIDGFAQAVLIAKDENASDENLVKAVVKKLQENDIFVVENTLEASNLIQDNFETTLPILSKEVVERCNLKALRAKDNKDYIKTTLDAVYAINPNAVGQVPALDSGFYA